MSVSPSAFRQYSSRDGRQHWKDLLDIAVSGGVAVVRRRSPVVLVDRDVLDEALAATHPFNVQVSFSDGGVAMWIDGLSVHGYGSDLHEAEEELLDSLLDYAESWVEDLHAAPNHRENAGIVRRVLAFVDDREQLHRAVFDESE